jgi:hypothetical protein
MGLATGPAIQGVKEFNHSCLPVYRSTTPSSLEQQKKIKRCSHIKNKVSHHS